MHCPLICYKQKLLTKKIFEVSDFLYTNCWHWYMADVNIVVTETINKTVTVRSKKGCCFNWSYFRERELANYNISEKLHKLYTRFKFWDNCIKEKTQRGSTLFTDLYADHCFPIRRLNRLASHSDDSMTNSVHHPSCVVVADSKPENWNNISNFQWPPINLA